MFQDSQSDAEVAALRLPRLPGEGHRAGDHPRRARRQGPPARRPAVEVNGQQINVQEDVREALAGHQAGPDRDRDHLPARRRAEDDRVRHARQGATTARRPQGGLPRPAARSTAPTWTSRSTIHLEDVGGPSAGLIFALAIVDKLTPGELEDGQTIAGTGEIDVKGNVGPIGGISFKLVAAKEAGATTFLVPADNCAEAKAARARRAAPGEGRHARRRGRRARCHSTTATNPPALGSAQRRQQRVGEVGRQLRVLDDLVVALGSSPRARSTQAAVPSRRTAATSRASRRCGCSAAIRRSAVGVAGRLAARQLRLRLRAAAPRSPAPARTRCTASGHMMPASASARSSSGSASCAIGVSGAAGSTWPARSGCRSTRSAVGTRANSCGGWSQPAVETKSSTSRATADRCWA